VAAHAAGFATVGGSYFDFDSRKVVQTRAFARYSFDLVTTTSIAMAIFGWK